MSTVDPTDLFLVGRGGANYKMAFSDRAKLQATDLLVVNRGGVDYKVAWGDHAKIQDTDVLLAARGGANYKCTFADYKRASSGSLYGSLYRVNHGGNLMAIATHVKLANLVSSNSHPYAVGADGHVYVLKNNDTLQVARYKRNGIKQVAAYLKAPNGTFDMLTAILLDDGQVYGYGMTYNYLNPSDELTIPGAPKCKALFSVNTGADPIIAIGEDGRAYVFTDQAFLGRPAGALAPSLSATQFAILGRSTGALGWSSLGVTLPGGRGVEGVAATQLSSSSEVEGVLILASDGTLWAVGPSAAPGIPGTGTAAAPVQVAAGTTFTQLNSFGGPGAIGIAALSAANDIWYSDSAAPQIAARGFYRPRGGAGFKTVWTSSGRMLYGVKQDGYLYRAPNGRFQLDTEIPFTKLPGQTKPVIGIMRPERLQGTDETYVILQD